MMRFHHHRSWFRGRRGGFASHFGRYRGPHRSRRARILGVCAGLAEHFDLSVKGVRIVAVILLIVMGFWPVIGLYLLAAILMKPAPLIPPLSEEDYQAEAEPRTKKGFKRPDPEEAYRAERQKAADSLKRTFDRLNGRLQDLEDKVTAKEFDWERRYNQS